MENILEGLAKKKKKDADVRKTIYAVLNIANNNRNARDQKLWYLYINA